MKSFLTVCLIALLIIQSITGLWGGAVLIAAPDGSLFNMPLTALKNSPFPNFLIPGFALFVLLGIVPGIAAYGMITRPTWKWPQKLSAYPDQFWAWTFALYVGLMLIIWIDVQVAVIGYGDVLQAIYAVAGLAITILSLLPAVKNTYKVGRKNRTKPASNHI
ncbi:MAG: hypothetical protein F9K23_16390 [Bacteroidetes bacterium]|nr:MAG: hypothetical protein F9K23_16390 [Bacteroidota bacterium]